CPDSLRWRKPSPVPRARATRNGLGSPSLARILFASFPLEPKPSRHPSEPSRLADVEQPKPLFRQSILLPISSNPLGRLTDGLVGELERPPMHRDEMSRLQHAEGLPRLLGIEVLRV